MKSFPKSFLWGAATSSHQIEGGTHNQWSVWELENAKAKAAQADYHYSEYPMWHAMKAEAKSPVNYVSGKLADHYNRYEEDFELLQKMNMNAYRFSIEWSRIEPKEGSWNAEAIAHYKDYIASLKRRGIEPILTLLHFSLPVWFMEKGGFEHRSNVKHFVRFAERAVAELGKGVKYVITINEPEVYAGESYLYQNWPPARSNKYTFWRVLDNQLYAHKKVYGVIKQMNSRMRIGIAKNSVYFYPGDTAWLSRVSATVMQWAQDDYTLRRVVKQTDFLGLNYYQSSRVFGYRVHNAENIPSSDVDWTITPGDIEYVLQRWHRKYNKPIMITENGVADAADVYRQAWIKETIVALQRAQNDGIQLLGYLHWSLLDNFEWAYGKWPRFGLASIDYSNGVRSLRPSAKWFGGVLKKLRNL